MPTISPAAIEYGGYISIIKLVVYVVLFFLWMPLVSWVYNDAQTVKLREDSWTAFITAAGVAVLVIWLLVPAFVIGLLIYIIALGAAGIAYVVHRNSKVADFEKVLTPAHIKTLFVNENKKILAASKGWTLITANGNDVPIPGSKTPDAFGFKTTCELFDDAIWRRASNITFIPAPKGYAVTYRVDGTSLKQPERTRQEMEYFIRFLKQLADLDINERRRPQTGSFFIRKGKHTFEWEITAAGSTAGEQMIAKRIEEYSLMKLKDLGPNPEQVKLLESIKNINSGLFIVSGPKRNGVTSTFYTMLKNHDPFMNDINTLEKKPAADLDNITQNIFKLSDTGTINYAQKLQSILRMGANIMGIADCEDKNCATLACNAAKNGKVIHVTLEATSVIQALGKWLKLVSNKSLALNDLVGIINQRLVRQLCDKCKLPYQPNPEVLRKFNMPADKIKHLYREGEIEYDKHGKPILCEQCQGTGFTGRTGIFEIIILNDKLRDAVKKAKSLQEIASLFRRAGMLYMQEQSIQKVTAGITSIHEVIRSFSSGQKSTKKNVKKT